MGTALRRTLRPWLFGLAVSLTMSGCTKPQISDITMNGVRVQIRGSAIDKTMVYVEGPTLLVNGHDYGAIQSGDTVEVSDAGVSVNGTLRTKHAKPAKSN